VTHPASLDTGRTRTSYRTLVVLCVCVLVQGVCLTWAFLSMRAVMDVGGACADGGPYVSAQPCPDGAVLIAVATPVLIISAMVGTAAALSANAPNLLIPMWGVLFGSLGWNFLEFAFTSGDGIVWGWLVCGVVFELMALPAILGIFQGVREMVSPPLNRTTPVGSLWWVPAYAVLGTLGLLLGWWTFFAMS
jgi:hypothetical protein